MKDRLFQLLGIEHGEESMVSMLLTQSVFLGIFYGAFDISAHSLFLAIFDEKVMARGYVVSGFTGIILTGLYTWLQTNLSFKNFAITNLIFVTLLTLFLWIALLLYPSKWVIFIVFVMLGPLNILAMLGFWGTTGRLFTLRQGKRLFGLVDAGLIIGIIFSCYAIPVLLTFKFQSHNILLISTASILVAAVIQILIGRSSLSQPEEQRKTEKKTGLSIFRDDSYIRIMGIFIALSVMTAFFVQYSFMAVTREQYPAEGGYGQISRSFYRQHDDLYTSYQSTCFFLPYKKLWTPNLSGYFTYSGCRIHCDCNHNRYVDGLYTGLNQRIHYILSGSGIKPAVFEIA